MDQIRLAAVGLTGNPWATRPVLPLLLGLALCIALLLLFGTLQAAGAPMTEGLRLAPFRWGPGPDSGLA
jgi:hypothetical protein